MPLRPNDTVLLLSPAFAVKEEVARMAMRYWQHYGLKPRLMPNALGHHNAYSGTDAERLADFKAALEDTDAKAIHALRGGYGFTRILDELPVREALAAHPKYLLGFSDITAGLLAWEAAGFGHLAVHAPMASHLADPAAPDAAALAKYLLNSSISPFLNWQDNTAHQDVDLTAPLTGGNLTLLAHAVGSRYPLQAAGKFLFIEEVGEQLYHIDRMLLQLRRAGALEGVAGLLLGHFTDLKDTTPAFGQTVLEIVRSHVPASVPVAAGLPAGHARPNWPLPFGVPLRLRSIGGKWELYIRSMSSGLS